MTYLYSYEHIIEYEGLIATVLDGALRGAYSKGQFAHDCNITPVFLSQIINREKMPSQSLAKRMRDVLISRALLSIEDATEWLDFVSERAHLMRRDKRICFDQVADDSRSLVARIYQLHNAAKFHPDPKSAAQLDQQSLSLGEFLRKHLNLINHNSDKIAVCVTLHDLYSTLNRHASALWAARRGYYIAQNPEKYLLPAQAARYAHDRVNSVQSEIVTLNNLGLYKKAYDLSLKLEQSDDFQQDVIFWKPHIYRDRLNSLAHLPRFAISEAEGLAQQSWDIFENKTDNPNYVGLLHLLTTQSLATALNRHNGARKSIKILEKTVHSLDAIPNIGPLHRVLVLRTYADSHWQLKNYDQWREITQVTLQISLTAGLNHQVSEINRELAKREHLLKPSLSN
jgi:hypothetical protein